MTALQVNLTAAYGKRRGTIRGFQGELRHHLKEFGTSFVPTQLYFAERLTEHCGGAKIYLKREDLLHNRCAQDQQRARPGDPRETHG